MEDVKEPEGAAVFELFKYVASQTQIDELAAKLRAGGSGWGHAKKDLLDVIIEEFAPAREKYNYFMENKAELDKVLEEREVKARAVARATLRRVRSKMGY